MKLVTKNQASLFQNLEGIIERTTRYNYFYHQRKYNNRMKMYLDDKF
jgi:hypothetical protein